MPSSLLVGRAGDLDLELPLALANRHGLVAGATGTGKTVTLARLAEGFSRAGVPVFLADVKGDLSGLAAPGSADSKAGVRARELDLPDWTPQACPVTFWDVSGKSGHPVRATVSDLGPTLFARLLGLNDTQEGVLRIIFKVADDEGLLLLDLKDLRAMAAHVGERATELRTSHGNVSAASVGAIQRGLLALEEGGGAAFFGEPMLDIHDLLQTRDGQGVINILAAEELSRQGRTYSTLLLWLLSELFEQLPEAGDLEKPKLVFFFDEAHLLFTDAPKALLETIEQVVRLIRSKGVGIYFVTQSPSDIPDAVLGQLGNRVQHALRAFSPRDQKAVKAAAETMRPNPAFDAEAAITELAVGEALVSLLDEKGVPGIVQRTLVAPPSTRLGPLTPTERAGVVSTSEVAGVYEKALDRESAYERLTGRSTSADDRDASPSERPTESVRETPAPAERSVLSEVLLGSSGPRGGRKEGLVEVAAKSALRSIGSSVGRQLVRGLLGSLLGGATGGRRRR
jgi:DNA helicase HerA-like ATPase